MIKRRRLADKLTIMVCAVLVAVSAFFYAPMEVDAAPIYDSSYSFENYSAQVFRNKELHNLYMQRKGEPITGNFDANTYYRLNGNFAFNATCDLPFSPRVIVYRYSNLLSPVFYIGINEDDLFYEYSYSRGFEYIVKGSYLNKSFDNAFNMFFQNDVGIYNFDVTTNITINSIVALTGEESASYEQGYNAGYSVGEEVGESNGYSSGYSDGFEAGEQSGYDSGFESGKESVDTQSYYDMGYSAGYDAGYLSGYDDGYDDGYDAGWQAYEDKISGWGADTSDYPILKYSFFEERKRLYCDVFTSAPSTSYDSALLCYLDFDIDPNHTYKFSVKTGGASGGTTDALYSDFKLNFVIGSNVFNAHNTIGNTFDFFIPGNNMGSTILLEAFVYDCVYYGGLSEEDGFLKNMGQVYPTLIDCYIDIYDMGPSGDTQNHIANQTDQLTGGYNDSHGNSVNNDFSAGLNDFETAEDSLFATATTGMKDFTFFDLSSVPAMVTGMSFVGSIMSGWFTQAGGASGVGIVLSILFSIMLVAMVLGLYRWYQSKGGKD